MESTSLIEYAGYIASILIAVSMFMKDIIKLRLINLIGSAVFVVYGLAIKAYPVAFTNIIIIITNIYYLVKLCKNKKE